MLFKNYYLRKQKKSNSIDFFLKMKKLKMLKKVNTSKFVHRFYAVEISKIIVSLIE